MSASGENPAQGRFRARAWTVIKAAISLTLLALLIRSIEWQEISNALRDFAWPLVMLSFVLFVGNHLFTAARIRALLSAQGVAISYGFALKITFSGLFANNFLPSTIGGDVVKYAMLARRGIQKSVSATSIVVDRAINVAAIFLLTPLTVPLVDALIPQWRGRYWIALAAFGLLALASLFIFYRFHARLSTWLAGLQIGASWISRVRDGLVRLLTILSTWLRQFSSLTLAGLFSFASIACSVSALWVLVLGAGSSVTFIQTAAVAVVVYFATLVPVSFNGLGVQEVSFTLLFSELSTPESAALTIAILYRLILLLSSLPGGLFNILPDKFLSFQPPVDPK